jgi:isopentenyl-diphosphate delta-isomerase
MREVSVILVSEKDEALGTMEKMEAHRKGALHRAFSIFIFDRHGRMLLQQRSKGKYHGGLLWTNACCSHPFPDEPIEQAAERRLKEEMGFSTRLEKIFEFLYHAPVENSLIEHEYDHVFAGEYNGAVETNSAEVEDYCFEDMGELERGLELQPARFTAWFRIAFPRVKAWWLKKYGTSARNAEEPRVA